LKSRIAGLETEYAIKYYPDPKSEQTKIVLTERELFDIISGILEKREFEKLYSDPDYRVRFIDLFGDDYIPEVPLINKPMMFMSNGSRFYMDTGFHPEYATPECKNALDILVYDRAGESLLEDLIMITQRKLKEQGFHGDIFVSKNNVDINGNTYGCHENYMVSRKIKGQDEEKYFRFMTDNLIPFLVTRMIFAGSGKILSGDQLQYQISQRADYINSEISSTTTSNRGIINSRDETLGDSKNYRRLHLIIGDSNMGDIPTFLKIGTTCIVLRMIEDLFIDFDNLIDNPVSVMKQISHDLTFSMKIPMKNGKFSTALDIQFQYLESAKRYFNSGKVRFSKVEMMVMKLWEKILLDIRENPASLHTMLDWATKKMLIDRLLKKEGLTYEDLSSWSFIINNIKKRNLENRIFAMKDKNPSFDITSFLRENMVDIEFNHFLMYIKESNLNLNDYYKMLDIHYKVIERDIRFHDIRQDKGIFYFLEKKGIVKKILDKKLKRKVILAKTKPPVNTRAKLRSEFIHFVSKHGIKGEANWDSLTILNGEKFVVDINSPFKTTSFQVEKLFEMLKENEKLNQNNENNTNP